MYCFKLYEEQSANVVTVSRFDQGETSLFPWQHFPGNSIGYKGKRTAVTIRSEALLPGRKGFRAYPWKLLFSSFYCAICQNFDIVIDALITPTIN